MKLAGGEIEALLNAMPDAMVFVDGCGKIVLVNTGAEAMFEYSRHELVGQPVELLLSERLRGRHDEHVLDYLTAPRGRRMGSGLDVLARRKDGAEFPVEVSLSPISTDSGIFVASAIRDVTDRKINERQLVEAREVAVNASHAKSEFLAAASHDLRQPLQTLTLLSRVLGHMLPEDSKAAAVVEDQSEALRLMGELVNSLLDVSKLESGVVQPNISDFSVSEILTGLRAEFAALADAKGLELIIEDCIDVVRTDSTLLSCVVQNLIGNAIRYTHEGVVRLRCLAVAEMVQIEVLDTGIGIPSGELDLIFDDFYQSPGRTGGEGQGVGLGLAIARRIAGLLGFSLEARSTVGEGSCFSLSVPRGGMDVCDIGDVIRRPVAAAAGSISVLVVDDDAAVADATAMLLASLGHRTIVASNTKQALQEISECREPPDLLICDYRLGDDENGIDAICDIRKGAGTELRAVLISGDTSSAIADTLRGIDDCRLLNKPVNVDDLLELVECVTHAKMH